MPAAAATNKAEEKPEYLAIVKTVSEKKLKPGSTFTYDIKITCSEENCVNATLTDALPKEFAGFAVLNLDMTPLTVVPVATWTDDGVELPGTPSSLTGKTTLSVAFTQDIEGESGLRFGTTASVKLTLRVPGTLQPEGPLDGATVTNTAIVEADNSRSAQATAEVEINVPHTIGADIAKTWSPKEATYAPGTPSTVKLEVTNTSNVTADKLVVVDPQAEGGGSAPDDAESLASNNPFRYVNFAGFGEGSTLPAGASAVQVDAYVQQGDTWSWVKGEPSNSFSLPGGVNASAVGGLRYTYTGAIAAGAAASVAIKVEQRSTDRNGGENPDLSAKGYTATNTAQVHAEKEGMQPSTPRSASATYQVTPKTISAKVSKTIADQSLPAGESTTANITATNTGEAVNKLTIEDSSGFFDGSLLTFDGFTGDIFYPRVGSEATAVESASITYVIMGGNSGRSEEISFTDGTTPALPKLGEDEYISSFTIVFTGQGDSIPQNAATTIGLKIVTSESAITENTKKKTNTASSCVTAANANQVCNKSSATLTIVKPRVDITVKKSIVPSSNLRPGQSALVTLNPQITSATENVKPTKLIVTDEHDSNKNNDFWNGFNLVSIEPTQVVANSTLTILVRTGQGEYFEIGSKTATDETTTFGFTVEELAAALTAAGSEATAADITGIRFVYESANGFAASVQPQSQLVFAARATTRTDSSAPTDAIDNDEEGAPAVHQKQTAYTNTVEACGSSTHETLEIDCAHATANTGIIIYPTHSGGITGLTLKKEWSADTVAARSSDPVSTTLTWTNGWGNSTVTLTDPSGNEGKTEYTAFDAFNLASIEPVSASGSSPSIKYDLVQKIELYYDGGWKAVTPPTDDAPDDPKWQSADGSFIGYTLSAEEQEKVTGVRIVLAENTEARDAAAEPFNEDGTTNAAYDPNAPRSGEGVQAASASAPRQFVLTWMPRATVRSKPGTYVSQQLKYNTEDEGVVENCALITANPSDQTKLSGRVNNCDTIAIYDYPPYVLVGKEAEVTRSLGGGTSTESILVPAEGVVKDSDYPELEYTLTAKQESLTPATHVRVTEPYYCGNSGGVCTSEQTEAGATADPFGDYKTLADNPFNQQTMTDIDIGIAEGVDLESSTVWLLYYQPASSSGQSSTFSTRKMTADAANKMSEADLADVVGISVTFQADDVAGGTISSGTQLVVKLSTRVRSTLRDSGKPFVPGGAVVSKNTVFVQSYNTTIPVDSDDPKLPPYDIGDFDVTFNSGVIDVATNIDISNNDTIMEPDADKSKTVTLTANQKNSTLSPHKVTLINRPDGSGNLGNTEHSVDFWTNFNMTSLPKVTFPAGADHLRISAYVNDVWVTGELQEWTAGGDSYELPDGVALANVAGLKFEFTKGGDDDAAQTFQEWNVPGWSAKVEYTVALRDTQRGSSNPVEYLPGSAASNALFASSEGILDKTATDEASDTVRWSPGEASIAIDKCAQYVDGTTCERLADAGTLVSWDITIKNAGTGYLDIDTVTDEPREFLYYNGLGDGPKEHPGYLFLPQEGGGGTLTAQPKLVSSNDGKLVFKWGDGENRMKPQETVKLRIWLELLPGITTSDKAFNDVTVTTKQTLVGDPGDAVPNNGSGDVTAVGNNGAKTWDHVEPRGGENLYVIKGVRGALEGAVNPTTPAMDCTNSTYVGEDGITYYRSPCVANTKVGGTDQWSLHVANAGTSQYQSLTFFEQLPAVGDTMLVKGDSRGSQYRPQLTGLPEVVGAPQGSTVKYEISTEESACRGVWVSNPPAGYVPCGTSGWTEVNAASAVDWSKVRGLRITVDFMVSVARALMPGKSLDITYSTTNWPKTDANSDGASIEAEEDDQYAWNQYGLLYRVDSDTHQSLHTIAPNKVGVRLARGSIKATKEVEGDAANTSPDSITATAVCTVPDVNDSTATVTFGGEKSKRLEFLKQKDGTYTSVVVSGIPYGASCEVKEDGTVGSFGETAREGDPATVIVDNSDTIADDGTIVAHPTGAATAAFVNIYRSTALVVKKTVDTTATGGKFGPFAFTLVCTTSDNRPVDVGLGESGEFTLAAEEQRRFSGIPANSTCDVVEIDADGAHSVVFLGDGVNQNSDGGAAVSMGTPSDDESEESVTTRVVTITNSYHVGTLTIIKKRMGPGAEQRGAGPFEALVACTIERKGVKTSLPLPNDGKVVLSDRNGYRASISNLLVGSECSVKETDTGGASLSFTDPTSGVIQIEESDDNNVTITNYFNLLPPTPPSVPSQLLPTPSAPSTQLPSTGVSIVWLVLGASVLLFAGILLSQRFSGTGMRRGSGKHKA